MAISGKKLDAAGDVDGQMKCCAKASEIYSSMAQNSLYSLSSRTLTGVFGLSSEEALTGTVWAAVMENLPGDHSLPRLQSTGKWVTNTTGSELATYT